ncbi:hypothetical protein Slin15195_G048530 [Septoria linicola]|uniref:Uncharacterized protein n=1 Tax=Septoria linicola TaxID=215465 RepID=A0A9Q9ANN8_9PEZI|nr:hypothetical protein Slin14017_G052090 [Septoria linicola]USW51534.1 hypothetical protein Slin15195_G048530 [Septoria linicola]
MQFSIITIIAAISSVALAQSPRPWCDRGASGNGLCEQAGRFIFCCAANKGGAFVNHKEDAYDAGIGACLGGLGTVMCAK